MKLNVENAVIYCTFSVQAMNVEKTASTIVLTFQRQYWWLLYSKNWNPKTALMDNVPQTKMKQRSLLATQYTARLILIKCVFYIVWLCTVGSEQL